MNKFRNAIEVVHGEQWRLIDEAGNVVRYGQEVTDFRGDKAQVWFGYPPKHSSSEGHVSTDPSGYGPLSYAGVFGLRWERL